MVGRAGKGLRPTLEREKLYHLVMEARSQGLSYNQIINKIEGEQGLRLSKSHLSDWIRGRHEPFGYVRVFDAVPRPELAYVIGVKMGDASTSVNRHHSYMIKLRVVDRDFAEEFARCLSVVLGRSPPRVKWHQKTSAWHTQTSSLLLFDFLRLGVDGLIPTISHCESCKGAFLRGFFDSEGSVSGRVLTTVNGDLEKIRLADRLLASLGIETTGPHLRKAKGGLVLIKNKPYRINKDQYYLYVRAASLDAFRRRVGFTILRKREALENALANPTSKGVEGSCSEAER